MVSDNGQVAPTDARKEISNPDHIEPAYPIDSLLLHPLALLSPPGRADSASQRPSLQSPYGTPKPGHGLGTERCNTHLVTVRPPSLSSQSVQLK